MNLWVIQVSAVAAKWIWRIVADAPNPPYVFLACSTLGVNHAELSAEFRAGRDVFLYRDLVGAETGFVGGAGRLVA